MSALTIHAPAKVNLYLGVSQKTNDQGLHLVQTVIHPLAFGDTVTIEPSDALECKMVPSLSIDKEENLAFKAARVMEDKFGMSANVSITIEKNIPDQAGLGGGSSDAAAVVVGLATLWNISLDDIKIEEVCKTLGADVASFITGKPALYGNVGDVCLSTYEPLEAPLVLVKPEKGIATKDAYRKFDSSPEEVFPIDLLLMGMEVQDIELVASHVANNLSFTAERLVSDVAEIRSWLSAQTGVVNPQITGSGSCVFAICDTFQDAHLAAQAARAQGWWSCATELSNTGVKVL